MDGSGIASGVVTLTPVGPYTSPDGQSGGSSSVWGRVVSLAKVVTPLMVSVAVTAALAGSVAWVVVGAAATLYVAYREFTTPDVATKLLPLSLPLQNQSGLYLGMHKEGVHGCAREYFGNHKPFSLVNVSGPTGDLRSGLSKQIADNAGVSYKTDLRRQVQQSQLAGGDCLTFTGRSDYKTRTELGMTKCHSIFTVISPNKSQDGLSGLQGAFDALLSDAARQGKPLVVPFIGTGRGGYSGTDLARALHWAYQRYPNTPPVVLAGWDNPGSNDRNICRDFQSEWNRLTNASSNSSFSITSSGSPGGSIDFFEDDDSYTGRGSYRSNVGQSLVANGADGGQSGDNRDSGRSFHSSLSDSFSGVQGAIGGACSGGSNGKKMYTLQGSGQLSPSSGALSAQERKFIQDGINRGKISIARDVPEKDKEDVLMTPLKDFQYGQIITYQSGGITRYFSVDTIRGEYKSTGCFRCPITQEPILGIRKGNHPENGTMDDRTIPTSLPGYGGVGTIVVTYNFQGGTQGRDHPHPGQPYTANDFPRTTYLPNNQEGQHVLKLLKIAFRNRLTFTVGTSNTLGSGGGDRVTWNDIHHKTSMTGGPQCYGYPDASYLQRVKDELKAKGIE